MSDNLCHWKYTSQPCGMDLRLCRYCHGPIESCDERCLAACQAAYPFERFSGVFILPEGA